MTYASAVKVIENMVDIRLGQPIRKTNDRCSSFLYPDLSGSIQSGRKTRNRNQSLRSAGVIWTLKDFACPAFASS